MHRLAYRCRVEDRWCRLFRRRYSFQRTQSRAPIRHSVPRLRLRQAQPLQVLPFLKIRVWSFAAWFNLLEPYISIPSDRQGVGTPLLDSPFLLRRRALRWILQGCINRLDEHVRSPRAGRLSEADIKVGGESGGFDLIESSAVFNHGLNTVTDDDQHVAIFGKLPFIGHASVSRDDPCPAVLIVLIECPVEDEVQSANFPLEAASVSHVDEGILRCREDVAGNNDIGAPEVDDAVAIGYGVRHRENLYRFVIVILPPSIFQKRVARRRIPWRLLFLHSRLNVLMSDDRRALACIRELVGEKRAR